MIQTLATFPASWNPFDKVDLVQTPTGDMLLVAWSGTGTEKTRVGLIASTAPPPYAASTAFAAMPTLIPTADLPTLHPH